jgi:alanine racemase
LIDPHHTSRLTKAYLRLDHLTHNLAVLKGQVGAVPLWPVIKANAYGHGAEIIARHLVSLGYHTLGVADVGEAIVLNEAGIRPRFVVLSPTLPDHSEALAAYDCEPVVCKLKVVEALNREAKKLNKRIAVHLKVDTGMGRVGIHPDEVAAFLARCAELANISVRGLMSHFPCADEKDKSYSLAQLDRFKTMVNATRDYGIEVYHLANSAGIFDIAGCYFNAVRPGIAIYGLRPSWEIANPLVHELKPMLEWKTQITFIKEVAIGTGLSYGHDFHTTRPSLIATIPVGYGDGLTRRLSNKLDVLVRGLRCPQVGRITMDMSLVDVTELHDIVSIGDEVVIIGTQGNETVTADAIAKTLDTINYEVVTAISHRVPREIVNTSK